MKKPLFLICAFVALSCLSGCHDNTSGIVLTTDQCCALYCSSDPKEAILYACASECVCEADAACGNGVVNDGEVCDGRDLNAKTCADLVPGTTGTLSCAADCLSFDLTKCVNSSETVCGNNVIEGNEKCDGASLNDTKCADLVPGTTGSLKCLSDCSNFDVSECVMSTPEMCGNGVLDPGEDCDGELLSGYTCKSILGPGAEGKLKCSYTCRSFDLSECTPSETCGNGARSFNEACDPNEENQQRFLCSTLYADAGGSRTCTSMCRWDTGTCVPPEHCGNGIFEPERGEECDPALASSFADRTCAGELGPGADGIILCSSLCKISYAGCGRSDTCGDGILQNAANDVNYHETCDTDMLNNKKCSNLGPGYTGTLKCLNNCTGYDFSDCHKE